jgi:4-hydroxyproline epimerase
MKRIQIIDSHTGGEPTRLVIGGFPELGKGSMMERRALLAEQHDAWRAATVLEPRGNDVIVGALLCAPQDPANTAGVIFFNNTGYLGMCGHGTIGLVASLAYLGRIQPGTHGIETPVGTVTTTLHEDGSVSVRNVPAYRLHHRLRVEVPSHGTVTGDVAWGGNWFFLVTEHQQRVASSNIEPSPTSPGPFARRSKRRACAATMAASSTMWSCSPTTRASTAATSCSAPAAPTTARPAAPAPAPSSPAWPPTASCSPARCGARPASSAAISMPATSYMDGKVIPTLRGRAHMSAEATLLIEADDPFGWGIRL